MKKVEMVEQVARAICIASGNDPDQIIAVSLVGPDFFKWNEYRHQARAAINAMRGPTDEMVSAGGEAVYKECGSGTALDDRQALASWTAMIDAALGLPRSP